MRKTPLSIKESAFEYFCKGLSSQEISKMLDLSFRTVQNYMSSEKWKEKRSERQTSESEAIRKKIIREYEKENG